MRSIIPKSVQTKIYKTGQTRGADDDVIYQNRHQRHVTAPSLSLFMSMTDAR